MAAVPTAPRPTTQLSAADQAAHAAGSHVCSPLATLRRQIARLEESLTIQRAGRDADLALLRNTNLSEAKRAEAENSFRTTAWEIIRLQGQLREYKAVQAAAVSYQTHARHAAKLAKKAASGEDLPAVDVYAWGLAEDYMASAKATLVKVGRLDLIGGAA